MALVEISDHGIRFPAAEEFDGVVIDARIEQGSGAARPKGAGADVFGRKVWIIMAKCGQSELECIGDVSRTDVGWNGRSAIGTEWSIRRETEANEVSDAARKRFGGTDPTMAGAAVTDAFAFVAILLCGESERTMGCGEEIGIRGAVDVQATPPNEQAGIL